jgi:hypothetical protein
MLRATGLLSRSQIGSELVAGAACKGNDSADGQRHVGRYRHHPILAWPTASTRAVAFVS